MSTDGTDFHRWGDRKLKYHGPDAFTQSRGDREGGAGRVIRRFQVIPALKERNLDYLEDKLSRTHDFNTYGTFGEFTNAVAAVKEISIRLNLGTVPSATTNLRQWMHEEETATGAGRRI